MAIDTERKRRSTLCVLPVPDGGINHNDRAGSTWNYSGLVTPYVNIPQWIDGNLAGASWYSRPSITAAWVGSNSASETWTPSTEVRE